MNDMSLMFNNNESSWCLSKSQYRNDINGRYELMGCDTGLPYYKHTLNESYQYYIHFDWCLAFWLIGSDIKTTTVYAYCNHFDLSKCNNDLRVVVSGEFNTDTLITIYTCSQYSTHTPTDYIGMQ